MHELRLVGVHEDGRHVILADPAGQQYRLPLDEALRAAALRDRPRLGQLQIEIEGGLRPAEVQSLIRRGLSAEDVAGRAGWPVEKVRRYEGPVLAERAYIADLARRVSLGAPGTQPATLEDRAGIRWRDRGVDRDTVSWDSARDEDGRWTVTATFAAGGRERTAMWFFDHLARRVTPRNDEARWLSQDEAAGPIPTPHVAAAGHRPSTVFDLEAEGGLHAGPGRAAGAAGEADDGASGRRVVARGRAAAVDATSRHHGGGEPIDLMAAMREHSVRGRRGRRRTSPTHTPGEDDPRLDALPLLDLSRDPADVPPPPAAHDDHPDSAHLGEGRHRPGSSGPTTSGSATPPAPARRTGSAPSSAPSSAPVDEPARPQPRRGGRPSVPSWDDIVFGTKGRGMPGLD